MVVRGLDHARCIEFRPPGGGPPAIKGCRLDLYRSRTRIKYHRVIGMVISRMN